MITQKTLSAVISEGLIGKKIYVWSRKDDDENTYYYYCPHTFTTNRHVVEIVDVVIKANREPIIKVFFYVGSKFTKCLIPFLDSTIQIVE